MKKLQNWIRSRLPVILNIIVAIIGFITGLVFLFDITAPQSGVGTSTPIISTPVLPESELITIATDVASLDERLLSMQQALATLPANSVINAQLAEMESNQRSIGDRLAALEQAILEDPAKALSIPLLRIELEHMQQEQEQTALRLENSISQFIVLGQWFIGLMITSIVGLAISNLLSGRGKDTNKDDK